MLCLVTFFAATVQAALGFGFGLIAVTGFVVLFNSAQAIQLVIILTFAMSLAHYPKLRLNKTKGILKPLIFSCLLGFPVGLWIYTNIDLSVLKLLIAIVLIGLCGHSLYKLFRPGESTKKAVKSTAKDRLKITAIGIVSGAMATSLAMPGPIVMLYLNQQNLDKDKVRALMTGFFVFAYSGALIFQWLFVGIQTSTWINAAWLLPFALLGTYVGHLLSKRISQHFFQNLVLGILFLSGLFMLFNQ